MAVGLITNRMTGSMFVLREVFADFSTAAATVGTVKRQFICPGKMRIRSVNVYAATAGAGAGATVFDVKINGTTIFTTPGNRPTLQTADTGFATVGNMDGNKIMTEGDIITYDVATIPATTGHAVYTIAINAVLV